MPRPKRQTTINDHFSPSRPEGMRVSTSTSNQPNLRSKRRQPSASDSEGSEGITRIRLSPRVTRTRATKTHQEEPGGAGGARRTSRRQRQGVVEVEIKSGPHAQPSRSRRGTTSVSRAAAAGAARQVKGQAANGTAQAPVAGSEDTPVLAGGSGSQNQDEIFILSPPMGSFDLKRGSLSPGSEVSPLLGSNAGVARAAPETSSATTHLRSSLSSRRSGRLPQHGGFSSVPVEGGAAEARAESLPPSRSTSTIRTISKHPELVPYIELPTRQMLQPQSSCQASAAPIEASLAQPRSKVDSINNQKNIEIAIVRSPSPPVRPLPRLSPRTQEAQPVESRPEEHVKGKTPTAQAREHPSQKSGHRGKLSQTSRPGCADQTKTSSRAGREDARDGNQASSKKMALRKPSASKPTAAKRENSSRDKVDRPDARSSRTDKGERPLRKGSRRVKPDADDADMISEASDDIHMDEPERFRTATRLRGKTETAFQRKLRRLKNQRLGIVTSTTEEDDDHGDSASDSDSGSSSDSDSDSDSGSESGEEDFIEDDSGLGKTVVLPHQFSLDSAQTPEFKFKVVFHYLVMLNVRGPGVLPLRGDAKDYFQPPLEHLRRMIAGHRDARVRSQIWRSDFVKALQTYPNFVSSYLDVPHPGCDACKSGRVSRFEVILEGAPYHRETHEAIDTDSEDEEARAKRDRIRARQRARRQRQDSSDIESEDSEDESLPRQFFMGRFCKARSHVYHSMSHWEDVLFYRIRNYYKDLLRALEEPLPSNSEASSSESDSDESEHERTLRRQKRDLRRADSAKRIAHLRARDLPHPKDVDKITEWMDIDMGYQAKEFRWFKDIITRSERLEFDKRTDD